MEILEDKSQTRSIRFAYIGFACAIAVLYDTLVWNEGRGFGFVAFVLAYIVGFLALTIATKQFRQPLALLLLLPLLVMSADVVLYNNTMARYWTPLLVGMLAIIFSVFGTVQNPDKQHFSFFGIPLFRRVGELFSQWRLMHRDIFGWRDATGVQHKKIAIGVAIAFPLLLLFGSLFSSADAVFADLIDRLFHIEQVDEVAWRVLRTVFLTLLVGGILYAGISTEHRLSAIIRSVRKFDVTIISTVLAILNTLFFVFVAIQIKYLFGGADFVLANEMTFAEYARQGFFELTWVMALSGLLLLATYRSFIAHRSGKFLAFLQVLLVVQVGVIAGSALRRMYVYQEAYGFTVLRLYVEWFIYAALVACVLFAAAILASMSFRRLWHGLLLLALVCVTAVSSINIDARIAEGNIERFLAGEKDALDSAYLTRLSVDAAPAIATLYTTEAASLQHLSAQVQLLDYWRRFNNEKVTSSLDWRDVNIGLQVAERASSTISASVDAVFGRQKAFLTEKEKVINKHRTIEWCIEGLTHPVEGMEFHGACVVVNPLAGNPYVYQIYNPETKGPNGEDVILRIYRIIPIPGRIQTTYQATEVFSSFFPTSNVKDNGVFSLLDDGRIIHVWDNELRLLVYHIVQEDEHFRLIKGEAVGGL